MLERRKFLKRFGALGMGLAFGLVEYPRSAAGHEAAAVNDSASDKQAELENLLAVEGWENLLDEVDCATVVNRYVQLEEEHASLFRFRGRCPFCQMQSFGIYEYEDSFFCEVCEIGGNAIAFLCYIEHLPYAEAVHLARRLLHAGSFGEKREAQQKWLRMVEEVVLWSHHILLNALEGSIARNWLQEQGISNAVRDRFTLGVMAHSLSEQLVLHLRERGMSFNDLAESGLMEWVFAREVADQSTAFSILIPCADASGHYWGFYEHKVRADGSEHSSIALHHSDAHRFIRIAFKGLSFPCRNGLKIL